MAAFDSGIARDNTLALMLFPSKESNGSAQRNTASVDAIFCRRNLHECRDEDARAAPATLSLCRHELGQRTRRTDKLIHGITSKELQLACRLQPGLQLRGVGLSCGKGQLCERGSPECCRPDYRLELRVVEQQHDLAATEGESLPEILA